MRGRAARVVLVCLGLSGAVCRRAPAPPTAAARSLPKGDAIWLTDPLAGDAPGLEGQLQRLGTVALFLPAGELAFEAGRWSLRAPGRAPAHRFEGVALVLVVRQAPESPSVLEPTTGDPENIAHAIATPIAEAIASYGRVAGVHLDLPFVAASAPRYARLVAALRRLLRPEVFVSVSLRSAPASDEERKQFEDLRTSVDAFVAFVFGSGERAEASAVDALHVPWWAGYDATAPGIVTGAGGDSRGQVAEISLDRLSGNPRVEFANDLSVNDASFSAITLIARGPVRLDGVTLEPGDRVAFRLPSLAEMLFQLGSNLAGKRYALGRVVLFGGATDEERLFSIGAFEDVLLGRSLAPDLEASAHPLGRGAVIVEAVNRSHHASIASRLSNWVEVDLTPARLADVQLGGFDRYETYDAAGKAVTPGRATRVRLFETLIAPLETILPARVVVRGALSAQCCRVRTQLIAAAGPEVVTDWSSPPAPPTPTPRKAAPTRRKLS